MLKIIKSAITNRSKMRIRMNNTPEGSWISIEPYLIVENILFNEYRLIMFVTNHWSQEGLALGWRDIPLTSITEVETMEETFEERAVGIVVDWGVFNKVFPEQGL